MKLQPICWVSFPISCGERLSSCIVCIDRRSTIYSSRPRFIMAGEILTGGVFIAFSAYGELCVVILFLAITELSDFS